MQQQPIVCFILHTAEAPTPGFLFFFFFFFFLLFTYHKRKTFYRFTTIIRIQDQDHNLNKALIQIPNKLYYIRSLMMEAQILVLQLRKLTIAFLPWRSCTKKRIVNKENFLMQTFGNESLWQITRVHYSIFIELTGTRQQKIEIFHYQIDIPGDFVVSTIADSS